MTTNLHAARRMTFAFLCVVLALPAAGRATSDDRQQILAHIDSLHVARQVDSVQVIVEPLLEDARAVGDSTFVLPLAAKLGRLWASFGQPRRGEPLLREASDLAVALGDSTALCDALRWLGYCVEQQGRSSEAEDIYRRQLAVSLARGDRRHEAWARVGLAYVASQDGRSADAIEDYRLAATIFRDLDDTPAALWTLNGLGAALKRDGRFAAAAACFGEVADLARDIGYPAVEALARNNQGSIEFAQGDPGLAMDHFRRAAELQDDLHQLQDSMTSRTNVAICLVHLGRLDEAAALLEELVRTCREGGFEDREITALNELAEVRRLQGEHHAAAAGYRRILARDDDALSARNRVEAAVGLAASLAALDSSAAALDALVSHAGSDPDRLRGETRIIYELALAERLLAVGKPGEALGHYLHVVEVAGRAGLRRHRVPALAGAARCRRAVGEDAAALELLREAADAWEAARDASRDPEWREQRGATGRLVYAQLAVLLLADGGAQDAERAFDAVQVFKGRTLAERIGGDVAPDLPVMTLARLQGEVLAEDEILLDAYLGPSESVLFVVTAAEIRAVLLPGEADLARRLRLHHELLATPPPAGNDVAREVAVAAGERLGLDLLGPVLPLLADRRVVYVPDGALNLVPLSVLVPPGEPGGPRDGMRVPSAAILGHLRGRGGSNIPATKGMLALAGATAADGRPLPGAAREVLELSRRYHGVDVVMTGGETAPFADTDLAPFDMLHLAAHARADDQRPWSSAITLDPRVPGGHLRADRIAALPLAARLAVLSACETGTGRVLSGEGVIGLSSAFLGAGVPAVVSSLWRVPDAATADLMEHFYAELAAGRDAAAALAAAQSHLRERPDTAHPFHWAGFVVVGDGAVTVVLDPRRSKAPWILTGAAVLLVVLLAAAVVRRPRNRIG